MSIGSIEMEKICVAVRVRPPVASPQELSNGNYWAVQNNHISLRKSDGTPINSVSYAFDHVFDEKCTNASVYELLTKDIIHAAVEGFNGTAFAYGQTSSGKTFTMNGSEEDPGIIHRAVKDIFENIETISDREFLIRVSYMEIYNEEINDLFAVENQKLPVHESLERGIFVAGLREEIVNNAGQVLKLMASGEVNRHFGETNMNVRSSRSHTIFRMVIESKGRENTSSDYLSSDAIRVSVLNLVDLAGSERIAKTGAGGVRLKEGKHINKSLMALGNVINKLSDGAKQRGGHIPYRDSKLTRILQPALGGNAKTSIICTVAPEEVHIEETKGTLQFASRAKRITNCAQVNEILTDAALLKRQKLEIEELRKKLQGSRAETLEQEILKLRNEMLKYELEREKLEMQLQEERKSHKERDLCIREQQMKIDNLSSDSNFPEFDKDASQGQNSGWQSSGKVLNKSNSKCHIDSFGTPCFKAAPNAFVYKRSNYANFSDYSPLPGDLSNVADEDTWLKLNKGYIADLDLIQMTPARTVQSFPSSHTNSGISTKKYRQEVKDLKRQLESFKEERNELQKQHSEQLVINDRLMEEISEIKQDASAIQEMPQKLSQLVNSFKDMYTDLLQTLQSSIPDGESPPAKLLSCTNEIATSLFSNLESYLCTKKSNHEAFLENDSTVQEQCKVLSEKLKGTITSLFASEKLPNHSKDVNNKRSCDYKDSSLGEETAGSSCNLDSIREKYHDLEKKLDLNNQILEDSREQYASLERDFHYLRRERETLLEKVSDLSEKLELVTDQKETMLKELNAEAQRRKHLQEEIKEFRNAFVRRQRSFMSFESEFKSKVEKLGTLNPVLVSKSLGC